MRINYRKRKALYQGLMSHALHYHAEFDQFMTLFYPPGKTHRCRVDGSARCTHCWPDPIALMKKSAKHYFCRHCGIHPFAHPRSMPELHLINVRCLDDFDLETGAYEINLFDGKNWETAFAARNKADWGFG